MFLQYETNYWRCITLHRQRLATPHLWQDSRDEDALLGWDAIRFGDLLSLHISPRK